MPKKKDFRVLSLNLETIESERKEELIPVVLSFINSELSASFEKMVAGPSLERPHPFELMKYFSNNAIGLIRPLKSKE